MWLVSAKLIDNGFKSFLGAQLITGIVNNPLVLMCEQAKIKYRPLGDECPLIDSCIGRHVNCVADRITDEHFNSILDAIGQWKLKSKTGDISLMGNNTF